MSLNGEHATAHLADFESARQQRIDGTRMTTMGATTAPNLYTELYVAPEILDASNGDAKPTPAGDMFSYGVCCLFACCLPPALDAQQQAVRRFAVEDGRQLAGWSRDAARQADEHLPALLDSLLSVASTNDEALAKVRELRAAHPALRHLMVDGGIDAATAPLAAAAGANVLVAGSFLFPRAAGDAPRFSASRFAELADALTERGV